ncbi:MAG TPA: efflux RND transporter periplasmic adaptor subunit [Stellaceae bacterium]|nr:efflux RND transporter periplasmic adaptor subunit [Stellaceae bacterium]
MVLCRAALGLLILAAAPALAQRPPAGPPAVGVATVAETPIRPSQEFVGRIQATERVNIVARVTAFIDQRAFTEGAEVKAGDLLYRLEQPPFQADVQAKQSSIDQFDAQLQNANVSLSRQKALLSTPAGQQSNVDAALATQLTFKAQLEGARAMLRQSQINLAYTEIRAPIAGKIGRTAQTVGNVVTPGSGILTTIVSQDPMFVVFPVPVRTVLDLRQRLAEKGGLETAVAKILLPNGTPYAQTGKLDFVDNTVNTATDTITLRGVVPNPPLSGQAANGAPLRELVDGEFVTVVLEDAAPVLALTVPRTAVLSDQRGNYVYVVGEDKLAQQRRITLGQSTPTLAVVAQGLAPGESVIVDGIQRVRPGQPVAPAPASPPAAAAAAPAPPQH